MTFKIQSRLFGWLGSIILLTILGTSLPSRGDGELSEEDAPVSYYYSEPEQVDGAGLSEAQGACLNGCGSPQSKTFSGNLREVMAIVTKATIRLKYTPYSLHPKTLKMIDIGLLKPKYPPKVPGTDKQAKEGNCFAAIKDMLRDSGFITPNERKSWNEGKAKNAGPQLEKIGFMNLFNPEFPGPFKSCADGPIGALCVYAPIDENARTCYSGKCSEDAGHIEMNLDEHGFPAQYKGNKTFTYDPSTGMNALSNKKYKLIGIYVKPNPNDRYEF